VGLDENASVGQRIAYHRRRKGMTQEVLAGLLGRTVEWLSQLERGARPADRLSTIVTIADALRIEPLQLLPGRFRSRRVQTGDEAIGTAPDSVAGIRDAMLRYDGLAGLVGVPDRRPVDLNELHGRIAHAFRCSQTERWSQLGPLLPDLLADAWHAVHAYTGDDQHRAWGLQSLTYRVTSGMLDRIGERELPWIAAERAMVAAERTEHPLLLAGAAWRMSVVLRHTGRIEASTEVPARAADALRPRLRADWPQAHSVYGALQLKAAVGSATLDDHTGVRDHLGQAAAAAELVGDQRNDYWFAFGESNVAIHAAWLALELGDPIEAIRSGERVNHQALPRHIAERATSHLITMAWAQHLRRRDDDAIAALVQARRLAPEQLLYTHRVHAMVATMLHRERVRRRHLHELASWLGIR
jgi:transcriptional regulator with XRE-family HTH domain